MSEPRDRFVENVRRHRERLGISQEELGHRCDIHRMEVSLLERVGCDPRLGTIVRIARALEVSPARLLDGIE